MEIRRVKERFLRHVEKTPSCWLWKGSKSWQGYGFVFDGVKTAKANRLAYELFKGGIPKGLIVTHTCDNPSCVNPAHLQLGTHETNIKERGDRGRTAKGSNHGIAKLVEADIPVIRQLITSGLSYRKTANRFNVHPATILRVIQKKCWAHV